MKIMIDTDQVPGSAWRGWSKTEICAYLEEIGTKIVRRGWWCEGRICTKKKPRRGLDCCYGASKGYKCYPHFVVMNMD